MRFPEKESKPFSDPCWTADDIHDYTGPIHRASVRWVSDAGNEVTTDHEAPSALALSRVIARHSNVVDVSYGPHTEARDPC